MAHAITAERQVPRDAPEATDARSLLLARTALTERRLELAGISTAILEGGDGQPIVLLHGPGEYAAKWLRITPALAKTHRLIAPDLPGHGASGSGAAPLQRDRVLAWLGELIAETCATPPVLVGQLLGGAMAACFAAAHGERLSRLVLVDALGLAPFQPAPEFGAALTGFIEQPNEDTHDRLWQHCAYDLDALRNGMGEAWAWLKAYNLDRARAADLRGTQQGLIAQFGFTAMPAADLKRISVPTVLIWGRHDLATPLQVAEAASAAYGWPLHVIENAADDPPIERPEAFISALRTALAGS